MKNDPGQILLKPAYVRVRIDELATTVAMLRSAVVVSMLASASALVAPPAMPATKARAVVTAPQMVRFRVRNGLNRGDRRPILRLARF